MFWVTERLLLRPGWPEDAEAVCDAIADEGIVRMLSMAPWPYSVADAQAFLSQEAELYFPKFLIFERGESGPPIGGSGLNRTESDIPELGYWIRRSHWGQGYATEAARATIAAARLLGHRRLVASHFEDNPASGAILNKMGFRETGRAPNYSLGRGEKVLAFEFTVDLPPL